MCLLELQCPNPVVNGIVPGHFEQSECDATLDGTIKRRVDFELRSEKSTYTKYVVQVTVGIQCFSHIAYSRRADMRGMLVYRRLLYLLTY